MTFGGLAGLVFKFEGLADPDGIRAGSGLAGLVFKFKGLAV